VIDDIKVDVIATGPVAEADLDGIEDGPRLFVRQPPVGARNGK